MDHVRPFIFKDAASDKSYAECITQAPTLSVFANATKVIKLMEEKKTDYVLLTKENKFMGYVTESLLLEHYRDNLKKLRIE